ncbi:TPA: hypothetical protein SPA83_002867 [Staphylococcus aureus]|nr:hypothetical protein [Staphylococcus aureus]
MANKKNDSPDKHQQSKNVDNRTYQQTAYDVLVGEKVKVVFTDNKALSGLLKESRMFELVLEVKRDGKSYPLIIAKAAVKYAAPIDFFPKTSSK